MSLIGAAGDGIICRPDLTSQQTLLASKGTVYGSPMIDHGVKFNGTTDYVSFSCLRYGVKSIVIRLNLGALTNYIVDLDGGTHYIWVNNGTVTATGFASPTIYVDGIATSTITLGKHTICIATSTAFALKNPVLGKKDANYFNGTIYDIYALNIVLSAEDAKDIYEQDTIQELEQCLLFLPLKSSYTDSSGNRVTENKGTALGTVKLGNGTTPSSFPTQLVPSGMYFDGSDGLTSSIIDPVEYNEPFFGGMVYNGSPVSTNNAWMSTYNSTTSKGFEFRVQNSIGWLIQVISTNYIQAYSTSSYLLKGLHSVMFSYDGSASPNGLSIYLDGVSLSGLSRSGSIAGTIKNGQPIAIGARLTGTALSMYITPMKLFRPFFGKGLFTARQAKIMHNYLMKLYNTSV